jgi:N6-adenosine-specific RNA methylase IME4
MSKTTLPIPRPGTDLIPDGWAKDVMLPWLKDQKNPEALKLDADSRLAGLEAYYQTLGADATEIMRSRRLLDIRLGELLPAQVPEEGGRGKKCNESLHFSRMERSRLRKLGGTKERARKARDRILEVTKEADLTQNAVIIFLTPRTKLSAVFHGDPGTANVILCDPPWKYEFSQSGSRNIGMQYPTMTLPELEAIDLDELAAPDAVMFMWTTSPKLVEALGLLKSWGFDYKTSAVWDKEKIGMGYYFRQRHELILVGSKGKLPMPEPGVRPASVFRAARGKHSAKPIVVYEALEQMYPKLPRLDMFARERRKGWMAWGNEV